MDKEKKVLGLTLTGHPGVLSHITGLFSRRAFNIGGILCGRTGKGEINRVYLLLEGNGNTEQIIKQLEKLHDVNGVSVLENHNGEIFNQPDKYILNA